MSNQISSQTNVISLNSWHNISFKHKKFYEKGLELQSS